MTPNTAGVTGRAETGATGSESVLLSLQAASGAQAELKVVTVKALRALALGNPASLLSSVWYLTSWAGRNGLLGMLGEGEQVCVCF